MVEKNTQKSPTNKSSYKISYKIKNTVINGKNIKLVTKYINGVETEKSVI